MEPIQFYTKPNNSRVFVVDFGPMSSVQSEAFIAKMKDQFLKKRLKKAFGLETNDRKQT